jgi:prevent-host-death family protein
VNWGVTRANGLRGGTRCAVDFDPSVVVGAFRSCFVQTATESVEPAGEPPLRRIAVSAMRERFADVLTHVSVRRERIVLTRHGRAVGAIIPVEDLDRLSEMDDEPADPPHPTIAAYRASWRRVTDSMHRRR